MVYLIEDEPGARIKVIGAGGCGGNAINHMIAAGLRNIDFVSVNTDSQALLNNKAPNRFQIGQKLTRGRGTGGNPEIGRKAALEDEESLRKLLATTEMVFVTAGLGGGTGTGSAPVIARFARESGALTVGVVTKPFLFEGRKRKNQADEGLRELKDAVDTLITIPNDRLLSVSSRSTTLKAAFEKADDVLFQAVRGISELVTVHGLINLDFADVRSVMSDMGIAMMGTAHASGEDRAVEAAQRAISSPLLEDTSIKGARGLLINVTGGPDMSLYEVNEAASLIQGEAHEEANIIFGAVIDEELAGEIRVTVIATGFGDQQHEPELSASRFSTLPTPHPAAFQDTTWPPVDVRPLPEFSTPEPPPLEASPPEAPPSPALEPEPVTGESSSEALPPPPAEPPTVEPEPLPHVSIPDPLPPQSHAVTFNGGRKPGRRSGLIKESILDLAAFVRRGGEEAARVVHNGLSPSLPPRRSRSCTICGAVELTETAAFCSKCGSSLRE
ncbi:MAG: cell division protein FtsZ [Deltaproteobacteria bacterium]|nr:cell division protein FtsZ [Deltaproteobacteria bacterium]